MAGDSLLRRRDDSISYLQIYMNVDNEFIPSLSLNLAKADNRGYVMFIQCRVHFQQQNSGNTNDWKI